MGEYSNSDYLDRIERSRERRINEMEKRAQDRSSLKSLKEELKQKLEDLENTKYHYANHQKRKKIRAQSASYDLRRFINGKDNQ